MIKRLSPGVLAVSWLFCSATVAQTWKQEPTGYRGVAFGASLKDARRQARFARCFKSDDEIVCASDRKIADVAVHELWAFADGRLVGVNFFFDSNDYSALREIFVEKYGKPNSMSHDDLQTLMGAKATNEIQRWKGEKVSVVLFRYANEITKGMASIETNA